ncbi:unnamed protein product, partial [Prorocentrum cordatum]
MLLDEEDRETNIGSGASSEAPSGDSCHDPPAGARPRGGPALPRAPPSSPTVVRQTPRPPRSSSWAPGDQKPESPKHTSAPTSPPTPRPRSWPTTAARGAEGRGAASCSAGPRGTKGAFALDSGRELSPARDARRRDAAACHLLLL